MICSRCKKATDISCMSYLNMDTLCPDCLDAEKTHPLYKFAKDVERQHVLNGDYKFPGVLHDCIYDNEKEANLVGRIKFHDTNDNILKAWKLLLSDNPNHNRMVELLKLNHIE